MTLAFIKALTGLYFFVKNNSPPSRFGQLCGIAADRLVFPPELQYSVTSNKKQLTQ